MVIQLTKRGPNGLNVYPIFIGLVYMSFFYMERGPRIIKYVRGENAQFKIQQEKKSQKIKQIVNNLQN